MNPRSRREFLQLLGIGGGVVFASSLVNGCVTVPFGSSKSGGGAPKADDFFFVQLSDTHWGFSGPQNPEASVELKEAVLRVNALPRQPDFVVFTGDLTHTTDDEKLRRERMHQFQEIVGGLKAPLVRFMAGEHDAALDKGKAYQEFFGPLHYSFDHKGIHFVVLDNVSDPDTTLGSGQLNWLLADLKPFAKDAPIVVFAHRPLFDLYPSWDWSTRDGADAIDMLLKWQNVTVFYGHIHQEHHQMTEHIAHHAAKSLLFPWPAPGSVPKKAPIPFDPAHPGRGLGFRLIEPDESRRVLTLTEKPLREGV